MLTVQCKACGGIYQTESADGVRYFHVCPPLSRVELQAAVDAGRVVLPDGETVDDAIQRRIYERANKRDENVLSTRADDAGTMKAAGAGVTVLDTAAPSVVVVD